MQFIEAELGKKLSQSVNKSKQSTAGDLDESEDTLANDSGSNTSLKDNEIKEGEDTFFSQTFLHKIVETN